MGMTAITEYLHSNLRDKEPNLVPVPRPTHIVIKGVDEMGVNVEFEVTLLEGVLAINGDCQFLPAEE